jgi:hypothetical protein
LIQRRCDSGKQAIAHRLGSGCCLVSSAHEEEKMVPTK